VYSSGGNDMHIRSTLDPISLHEVPDPEHHPCLYEGDGVNGVEVYFENEENKKIYMEMELEDKKVLIGNDTDDYIAEG
jgi:hypothetical protein